MSPTESGRPAKTQNAALPEEIGVEVDAFCIGAAKSGSTWLAQVVDEHPEVQVSQPKETNFFTAYGSPYRDRPPENFLSSGEWYAECFPADAAVNVDFSIHTIADPDAPERIRAVYPDARFLMILRDPVKRLYSHYKMEERKKMEGMAVPQSMEPTFEQALQNDELVRRSRYAELMEPWLEVFPRQRFHVVVAEECRKDPESAVQDTFRFLGVDDSFKPPRVDRKVHPIPARRGIQQKLTNGAKWARCNGMGWFVDPISRRFPYRTLKRVDKKTPKYDPLDPRLEAELREGFLPEVEKLERTFGLDLELWKHNGH